MIKDSLIRKDLNGLFILQENLICLSEIRLKMEWIGFLWKIGEYSDEKFLLSKSKRFALNIMKLLLIYQACAAEQVISKNVCLR